jgi:hypothetical protein
MRHIDNNPFALTIRAIIHVDDDGKLEAISLINGQDLPRVAQHQIMVSAHTAWQKSIGGNALAVIETAPVEKGQTSPTALTPAEPWSKFRAYPHSRSYEI